MQAWILAAEELLVLLKKRTALWVESALDRFCPFRNGGQWLCAQGRSDHSRAVIRGPNTRTAPRLRWSKPLGSEDKVPF